MAFERGTYLMGIKYWAQWYSFAIRPQYEVFLYYGRDKDKGVYYFKARKQYMFITKGFNQLDAFGFKPFVLDFKDIQKYLKGIQNVPPIST